VSVRRHSEAIARLIANELEKAPPRTTQRLLRPQVRWVAQELDEVLARDLGVRELVERCRDEHLRSLDADEGLAALGVPWQEIVASADRVLDDRGAGVQACPRCGARLGRRPRCGRCRRPRRV
jgi:hypothetical protein